jgi:hypothetical protein
MKRSSYKAFLAAVLMILAAASAKAATGWVEGKGLKFGFAISDMTGAGVEPGLNPQTGFSGGAFLTMALTDVFSVQPEIIFTKKGAEFESGAVYYEYHYYYVEFPVLLKLILTGPKASFRPNVYAGPFLSLKVGAKLETYLDPVQEESKVENLPSTRGIDAGYVLGLGADMPLGPGRILLDIRYGRSLLSAVITSAEVKHSVFCVFLGYAFH